MINKYKKKVAAIEDKTPETPDCNPAPETTAAPSKQSLQQTVMDSVDVQQLLHISRSTLYNWRKKGLIAFSKVGGKIYFDAADVYRMLQERKQRTFRAAA